MSRVAFLFPGQGAQHVGMCKSIVERFPAAKDLFNRASEILKFDLADACVNGPEEKLNSTDISQPALFVSSFAALEMLKNDQPELLDACEMAAGLSLGEYTALTFAGAMSFEDGLRVVQKRGQAMQAAADATPSGMVSILMVDIDQVQQYCDQAKDAGQIQIANYLCPGNTVVSGDQAACDKVAEVAEEAGAKTVKLSVAGAFHTSIMKPADEQLAAALESVEIQPPKIPVVSNVDAQPHTDPAEIREILIKQVLNPVRWEDSVRYMLDQGIDQFYEIGPGKVLKGLLKRVNRKIPCESVNDS